MTCAKATCNDKDGVGMGTAAVSDSDCGAGFLYNSANAASTCASTACDISGTAADKTACCVAQATCDTLDCEVWGSDASIINLKANANALYCAGTTCDVSTSDKAHCCELATCGDADGYGAGTAAVTDTDCGDGFYPDSLSHCQACDASCASCSGPDATDCLTCPVQTPHLDGGACSCRSGYAHVVGVSCTQVDECSTGGHDCFGGAAYCTDLVGGMNALLHAAVLRSGAVENPTDKFVFVSDSTLPVEPLVPMVQRLTSDENSDFCVFPRNEWAEVPQNMPGGVSVTHLAVKHHQWVVLSRKHAEQAVARSHMHQDLMSRFQLNMGYHNTGCLDEFWHFATLYPELVILDHPATNIELAGLNGGISNSNYEIQGKCDTFVHWVPRAEGRSNHMSYLAKALASDPGTIMAPATESRPASFSRLSGDALVSFRKSGFLFTRKVDDMAVFSGCASLADAFDQLIFKDNPSDVLPGQEMPYAGQGDWLDNQRTIVSISSSHGSVRLQGTGSDMHATGGYCGNTIDIVFENGYRASATVSPNGQWLRWSNGAVWPRA